MKRKPMKKYIDDLKFQTYLANNIRCKCPNCGHTVLISVKYDKILCTWCNNFYTNNSKAYKLKKIKEMIRDGNNN